MKVEIIPIICYLEFFSSWFDYCNSGFTLKFVSSPTIKKILSRKA